MTTPENPTPATTRPEWEAHMTNEALSTFDATLGSLREAVTDGLLTRTDYAHLAHHACDHVAAQIEDVRIIGATAGHRAHGTDEPQ